MPQVSQQMRVRLLFVFIGVLGAAFAITGLFIALPRPAAGGTCGPSTTSETPAEALTNPVSIGAGPEPAATKAAERQNWEQFVNECQSAADDRGLAAVAILVVSAGVAIFGPVVVERRRRRKPPAAMTPYPTGYYPAPYPPYAPGSAYPYPAPSYPPPYPGAPYPGAMPYPSGAPPYQPPGAPSGLPPTPPPGSPPYPSTPPPQPGVPPSGV